MKTIEIDGNAYQLDVEKAKKLGLLKDARSQSWEEYCNNTKRNIYDYIVRKIFYYFRNKKKNI